MYIDFCLEQTEMMFMLKA